MAEEAPWPGGEPRTGSDDDGCEVQVENTLTSALAPALVEAVRAGGGYGGGIYLRSRDRRSLVLAMVAGIPRSLLKPWWRVPVSGAVPAAEAYRNAEGIHLSDEGETMRRFPQMSVGLPYPFASAYLPVLVYGEVVGVLIVMRSSTRGNGPAAGEDRLRTAADAMGEDLARLQDQDCPIEYDEEPFSVRLPAAAVAGVRVGLIDWDLGSGTMTADDEACAVLGADPATFGGTLDELEARVSPDDLHELRASRREATEHGWVRARRFRVLDGDAGEPRYRQVEMWGRVVGGRERPESHRRLVGVVVDAGTGTTAAEAAERLPDGVFSMDQDGRVTYTNHRCEQLLRHSREELLGRHPWEVLHWLSDPSYEDRYRAAMLSQEPASFLARHPDGGWLGFILYPDASGLTGRVFPTAPPLDEAPDDRFPEPDAQVAAPVALRRPGALYHVVHMASVLTEAVTVREVCIAVADQLLPAFGGQELALYVIRDGRMHLAWESGYPDGFLEEFEGVPLDAHLPGVETLTSGVPIFFESPRRLSAAYPGISLDRMHAWAFLPLIASGHPVGSCILGYDAPHTFTADERAALTALGGLVAQAMERARLYDAEFTLARGLQDALLPHRLPPVEGLRTAGRYLPGTQGMEIGGDWYDVIVTGRGVALVIGDVEGHNVAAAAVMGQLRSAVNAFATSDSTPVEVLSRTNRLLADLDAGVFATCCYIELDPATGRAHAVRAGHPPPLLRHPDGRTEQLQLAGGTLLGVDPDATYPVNELELPRGSVLALYTDGLVEQPGVDIDQGVEAVLSCLARTPPDSLEHLADLLVRQARRAPDRPDDVALLLTAYTGTDTPPAGAGTGAGTPAG
ncbi:SpoIIE family protein phosphatase [Streptomyces sp. NPDC001922]|uniref:SpoIIE family protein phosphatase n=1 Tax=Streptomyces sp. NPDC001922 TaxID=3364624 RepID=UPI0036987DB8